jgi:hypothetical protein
MAGREGGGVVEWEKRNDRESAIGQTVAEIEKLRMSGYLNKLYGHL